MKKQITESSSTQLYKIACIRVLLYSLDFGVLESRNDTKHSTKMWKLIIFLSIIVKCAVSIVNCDFCLLIQNCRVNNIFFWSIYFLQIAQVTVTGIGSTTVGFPGNCVYDKYHQSVVFLDFTTSECSSKSPCFCCFNTVTKQLAKSYIKDVSFGGTPFIIPAESPNDKNLFLISLGYQNLGMNWVEVYLNKNCFVLNFKKYCLILALIRWDCSSSPAEIVNPSLATFPDNTSTSLAHRDPSGSYVLIPVNVSGTCGTDRSSSIYLWRRDQPPVQVINNMVFASGFAFHKKIAYIADGCLLEIVAFKVDCDFNFCK